MAYECNCGWRFVGEDTGEELQARIDHLQTDHGMNADTDEWHGKNAELIILIHDALDEINTNELDGWYTSMVERMRDDAGEIVDWEGFE